MELTEQDNEKVSEGITEERYISDFDSLFTEVYPQLFSMAFVSLRNYHEAEDAVQEAAMLAYKNFSTLKNIEHFKTWITRILINCCNKQHKILNKQTVNSEYSYGIFEDKTILIDDEIILFDALKKLNKTSRQIVILKYFSDCTVPQISEILGIPEGTVKSRLSRSLDKLKLHFNDKEDLQ